MTVNDYRISLSCYCQFIFQVCCEVENGNGEGRKCILSWLLLTKIDLEASIASIKDGYEKNWSHNFENG